MPGKNVFVFHRKQDVEVVNYSALDISADDDSDAIDWEPKKKKSGWKSTWNPEEIDDLVDIVVNNEYYQRKLIFTNTKCQRNSQIYQEILKELKLRASKRGTELKFNAKPLRTKFKKCISDCKQAALTMKNASGIKRFQENRGLGDWFKALFPLVKSRDSCQPDQAIEPDSDYTRPSPNSEEVADADVSADQEILKNLKRKNERKVFVPVKKSKKEDAKKKMDAAVLESLGLLKEVVNNDTSKDMISFLREEMDKSREHELKLIQVLNSGGNATQQQHPTQSMSSYGNTHYIEKGSVANFSQNYHGPFAHNLPSLPEMPQVSFANFTSSPEIPSTSVQNFSDTKVYHQL